LSGHTNTTSSTLFHTATNLQKSPQSDTKQIKTTIARKLKERWEAKRLHGQFLWSLDEGLINKEQSYRWLKFGDIKGETESVIMVAQDSRKLVLPHT
jgi:IS30 family transposase